MGASDARLRSTRLYRRALRILDPASALPANSSREQVRDAARARLAMCGPAGWLRRRGRVLASAGLFASFVFALVLVLVPSLRQILFRPDLAAHKPWIASSAWGDFPRRGRMEGQARVDGMFHTLEEPSPAIVIDLESVQRVREVEVVNRTNCCQERALPLAVELSTDQKSWQRVGYRRSAFATWTAVFSAQPARFVRLRVDRRSVLHLRRVSVR